MRATVLRLSARVCVVILLVGLGYLATRHTRAAGTSSACEALDAAHVVVDLRAHQLLCCEGTRLVASYRVRIGSAGAGKREQGDQKTPVGLYKLGTPRRSTRYYLFIPIGYPTAEQVLRGFTGSDIGVHGPDRRLRWLGRFVNALDTTDGCVGLATDRETEAVANWVQSHSADRIYLR